MLAINNISVANYKKSRLSKLRRFYYLCGVFVPCVQGLLGRKASGYEKMEGHKGGVTKLREYYVIFCEAVV